jgi:hypothetical protein
MGQRKPWILGGCLCLLATLAFVWWWNRPPQMGNDSAVMDTVDALFTAVSSRDSKRLAECEKRLATHKSEGRITPEAARWLEAEIDRARTGAWKTASQRVYDFGLAQRRDGAKHSH